MNTTKSLSILLAVAAHVLAITATAADKVYHAADFGIVPGTGKSQSALMQKALESIRRQSKGGDKIVFHLAEGRYDFYPSANTTSPTTTSPTPKAWALRWRI